MSNEGESTDVLDLLREMREEIRLEKSKREESDQRSCLRFFSPLQSGFSWEIRCTQGFI